MFSIAKITRKHKHCRLAAGTELTLCSAVHTYKDTLPVDDATSILSGSRNYRTKKDELYVQYDFVNQYTFDFKKEIEPTVMLQRIVICSFFSSVH